MAKDFDTMEDSNRSSNPSLHSLSAPSRRHVLQLSLGAATSAVFGSLAAGCAGLAPSSPRLGLVVPPAADNAGSAQGMSPEIGGLG